MLGLLNTVLSRGGSLLTYVKDGLVMANRFLTPPKITHPAQGSAEFNGTSDYIDIPDTNLPSGTSARTISAWIYPNANDNGRILSYGTGSANAAFDIITQASTNVLAVIGYATNYFSTTTISTDEWTFVSVTLSSNTLKMYVNGSEVYSTGSASINTTLSGSARIGKGVWDTDDWNGNIANVAIWNRALSSDEINSVMWKSYEGLEGAESNGLQAWYSLDDISSPAASLANMEQLATDKNATIENKAAVTAAINALS